MKARAKGYTQSIVAAKAGFCERWGSFLQPICIGFKSHKSVKGIVLVK